MQDIRKVKPLRLCRYFSSVYSDQYQRRLDTSPSLAYFLCGLIAPKEFYHEHCHPDTKQAFSYLEKQKNLPTSYLSLFHAPPCMYHPKPNPIIQPSNHPHPHSSFHPHILKALTLPHTTRFILLIHFQLPAYTGAFFASHN